MTRFRMSTTKKTVLLLLIAVMVLSGTVFSQGKKTVQFEISSHGSYFRLFGDAGWGYGGSAKLLLPIDRNENYITAGLTVDRLRKNRYFTSVTEPVRLINAVGGYRKMIRSFFIEPEIGIGIFQETYKANGPWESDKTYILLNIFPGIESGFHVNKITFSLSYRHNFRDPFKDEIYSILSIKAGYRFRR